MKLWTISFWACFCSLCLCVCFQHGCDPHLLNNMCLRDQEISTDTAIDNTSLTFDFCTVSRQKEEGNVRLNTGHVCAVFNLTFGLMHINMSSVTIIYCCTQKSWPFKLIFELSGFFESFRKVDFKSSINRWVVHLLCQTMSKMKINLLFAYHMHYVI